MGDGNDAQEGKIKYLDQFFTIRNVRSLLQMSLAIETTMAIFFRGDNLAIHFTTNRCKTYFVTIVLAIYQITSDTLKKISKDKDLNLTSVEKLSIGQSYRRLSNMYIQISCYCLRYCRILFCLFIKNHHCGDSKDKKVLLYV